MKKESGKMENVRLCTVYLIEQIGIQKVGVLLLTLVLSFVFSFGSAYAGLYENTGIKAGDAFTQCGGYLYKTVTNPACDGLGGEWVLYGLATAKYDMSENYLEKYKESVEKTVKEGFRGMPGILHNRKYTEYSRVVYCFGTLSKYVKEKGFSITFDPTNVAGYNLLEKLSDFDRVVWQGINGPIWTLLALDSNDYELENITASTDGSDSKEFTQATRQMYIDYIIKYQHDDGGWSMDIDDLSTISDPDVTGMAVQALANYRSQSKVKQSIEKAIECMSLLQNSDGTYSCYGAKNSESCAQIIMALTKLGIDSDKDERFIKGGNSVMDSLLMFYDTKTGGFRHVNEAQGGFEATVNQMATEQGFYALANYLNFVPKPNIKSAKSSKTKNLTVTIEKQSLVSGYEILISTTKNFKSGATKKVDVKGISSKTISNLKSKKNYYVKVRAYRELNGEKVYGKYCKVKSVEVKG